MQPTNKEIAKAFSTGNFKMAYDYLADNMEWNMVGDNTLIGKQAVIDFCTKTAAYFASQTTLFTVTNIIDGHDCIAIDGTAKFISKDDKTTHIASCDVYRFKEGKLQQLTSYCIRTNKTENE
jgi:ketosteroid isomerase-like protein